MMRECRSEVLYADRWKESYLRNNKQSGMKNLRCFPFCSDPHQEKRFCGRPVTLRVAITRPNQQLFAWAMFAKAGEPLPVQVGAICSLQELRQKERSKKNPLLDWYVGTLAADNFKGKNNGLQANTAVFKFNQELQGWNYKWVANVHTHKQQHNVVFFIFAQDSSSDDVLRCIDVTVSPEFQVCSLYTRRKAKSESLGSHSRSSAPKTKLKKQKVERRENAHPRKFPVPEPPQMGNMNVNMPNHHLPSNMGGQFQPQPGYNQPMQQPLWPMGLNFGHNLMYMSHLLGSNSQDPMMNLSKFPPNAPNLFYGSKVPPNDSMDSGLSALQAPHPLRTEAVSPVEEPKVPDEVLPYFFEHEAGEFDKNRVIDPTEDLINRKFWRFCVLLPLIESHWARPDEQGFDVDPLLLLGGPDDEMPSLSDLIGDTSDKNEELLQKVRSGFAALADFLIGEEHFSVKLGEKLEEIGKEKTMPQRRFKLLRFFLDEGDKVLSKFSTSYKDFEKVFDLEPPEHVVKLGIQRLRIFNEILQSPLNLSEDNSSAAESLRLPALSDRSSRNSLCLPQARSDDIDRVMRSRGRVLIGDLVDEEAGCQPGMLGDNLLQGWWLWSDAAHRGIDVIRERFLKGSWIARSLLRSAERHFSVKLEGDSLVFAGRRKLLARGTLSYIIDGRKHPVVGNSVLFPIALPSVKYYRAILLERHLMIEEYYHPGGKKMVQKLFAWKDDELISLTHSYYEYYQRSWHKKYDATGWVLRCNQGPKVSPREKDEVEE